MFILFIIAGMILSFALFLFINRILFLRNGIIAEATVAGLRVVKSTDHETSDSIYPTVKFCTRNNEEILFESDDFGADESWQIGDKVTIVYHEQDPSKVVRLTYGSAFGHVIFLFCVALVLILIAGGYYWAQHFFNTLG
jgi:hypothetical protein